MTVYAVPTIGGPTGPTGPPGPDSPLQQFGMIYRTTASGLQALVAATYQKLTVFGEANGPSSGVTPAFASSSLTIVTAGTYYVYMQVSYAFNPAAEINFRLYVNGSPAPQVSARNITFGFFPSSSEAAAPVSLAAADVLEIYVNPTVASSVAIHRGQFYVERLDP